MEKLTIGKEKLSVLQGIDEMNYRRSVVFNEYSLMVFEEINYSQFALAYDRAIQYHNAGDHYNAMGEFTNYKFKTDLKRPNIDALGRCFAMIVLTEDELKNEHDPKTWDENHLNEKLERWSKAGLKRGEMMRVFENFLHSSPSSYPLLEKMIMWKMMNNNEFEELFRTESTI